MRTFIVFTFSLLFSAALLALPATALAQQLPTYPVELNKGKLVRLDSPASSVMVADPNIADIQVISPTAIYVHGKAIGETSLLALDRGDNTVLDAVIEVTHNISKLQRTLKTVAPDADVQFRSVDGGLVIEGFVDNPQQSEAINNIASTFLRDPTQRVINMIDTAGSDQVTLMVKVAEVSRTELKRFGINITSIINKGNFLFNVLQGRAITTANGLATRNASDNSLFFNWDRGNDGSVDAILDALQQDGLVSILAEPTLTTTSGKPASFLAGGEVPIPTVDSDGAISVEYRQFGITLNFTPTVLSEDKISLNVTPEVSSISSIDSVTISSAVTYAIPSLQVRRAQTTVELASGQTFAIAGLFKNDRNNSVDRFPGLGDVPVLGSLFRSHNFQNDQTELVILVTPYLTHPVRNEKELVTPLDGYYPPTDIDRLLKGKLSQKQEMTRDEVEQLGMLHGKGGFILE